MCKLLSCSHDGNWQCDITHNIYRAELHGEELLSHISKFLLNNTSSSPLPVAMVIEGLVALCRSEVTDVATLWGVMENPHHSQWKVVDDNRSDFV